MFDLANVVPTLARFYQQASEAYEQACTRYINSVINYVCISTTFLIMPSLSCRFLYSVGSV